MKPKPDNVKTTPVRRARLSKWTPLCDQSAIERGIRRLFLGRPMAPFEVERVRVPLGVQVVEVKLGRHRYPMRPGDRCDAPGGADYALPAIGRRRLALGEGRTMEVLVEATEQTPRCVPVALGRPVEHGLSCVPLAPIERTEVFDVGEGVTVIDTEPVQRGKLARIHFLADDLEHLDLAEMKVGRDSQFVVAAEVPLAFFREGLALSCDLERWHAMSFRLRNRGGPIKLSIDIDVSPPNRVQV